MLSRQYSEPIKTINAFQQDRVYKFKLLDAETGCKLFHEHAQFLIKVHDVIRDFLVALFEAKEDEEKGISLSAEKAFRILGTNERMVMVIKQIPELVPWVMVKDLAKVLLCEYVVEIDGEEYIANENGFNELAGDPLETYAALLHAVCANYKPYTDPLKAKLALFMDTTDEDSTQG
jgi:hypothetical protein